MKPSEKTTLGLDVSTSITGASILQGEKIIETHIWDMRNKNNFSSLFEKARFVKDKLWEIDNAHHITSVVIEKPFMFFNSGGSTAKTMSILQNFNGMISWICCDIFKFEPHHITVRQARKLVGLNIKRGEDTKKKVLQFILDKYPHIEIEYTKHGNPRPGMLDMCDSIVIGVAGSKIEREDTTT